MKSLLKKTSRTMRKLFATGMVLTLLAMPSTAMALEKGGDAAETVDSVQIRGGISVGVQGKENITSLSLRNANVRDVLYMLSEQAGFNIILDDDVSGTLNLDLKDVSINKMLDYVMTLSNLTYTKDGNTLIVVDPDTADKLGLNKLVLKSIPVKYSNAQELTDVLNETVFSITRPGGNTQALATADLRTNSILIMGNQSDIDLARRALSELDFPLQHKTFFLKYATPATVANSISNTLFSVSLSMGGAGGEGGEGGAGGGAAGGGAAGGGAAGGGAAGGGAAGGGAAGGGAAGGGVTVIKGGPMTFITNTANNTLTMIGSKEQIELAESLLYDLDIRPAQVIIQAAIVELTHDKNKSLQAGLNPIVNRDNNTDITVDTSLDAGIPRRTGDGNTLTDVNTSHVTNRNGQVIANGLLNRSPSTRSGTGLFRANNRAFRFSGSDTLLLWDKSLAPPGQNFLRSARMDISNALTKGKILSNPTVLAVSGQSSNINVSSQVFAGNRTTVDRETGITTSTPILTSVGITLNITPEVRNDGTISMNVQPSVSAPSGTVTDSNGNVITLTSSSSLDVQEARVKNGETLILGGLIQESQSSGWNKVPFLSDIPILGALFRATSSNSNSRTEIIVLVTPQVVKEEGVAFWREDWRRRLSYDRTTPGQYYPPSHLSKDYDEVQGKGKFIPASNTRSQSEADIKTLEHKMPTGSKPHLPKSRSDIQTPKLHLPTYSEVLK